MSKNKKSLATNLPLSVDRKAANIPKREIYYVRVKRENKEYMEERAQDAGMTLAMYTDAVIDKLRGV